MLKTVLLLTLTISFLQFAEGQKKPRKKTVLKIEELINQENFSDAAKKLQPLVQQFPEDAYLQLLYGTTLLNIDYKDDEAIPYLEFAKRSYGWYSKKNDYAIEANFHLARAYHLNHRFEEALRIYQQLKDTIPSKRKKIHQQLQTEINHNQCAIELKKKPVNFRITNLNQAINSEYDEHSPIVSADESVLLFTSNRQGTGKVQKPDQLFSEDIYQSIWREGKWLPSTNLGPGINTEGYEATSSLSADGQTMILYRNLGHGDLYISHLKDNKWSTPKKLPKPINSNFEESHGALSADGQTLIFASNRPGGLGGKDIYRSRKLPDGSWGKIVHFGENINTAKDEESPFLSYDGKEIFFASEGHTSMGGFDIFCSKQNEKGKWTKAVNIGYPINTPGDDLFYVPTIDKQRVYFASERPGSYGRSDIFLIEYPETDERTLAVVSGFVFTEEGTPSNHSSLKVEKKEGGFIGIYKPNDNNGKYIFILPTGIDYVLTISTPNKTTIKKAFKIPSRSDYNTQNNAVYLDPIIVTNGL